MQPHHGPRVAVTVRPQCGVAVGDFLKVLVRHIGTKSRCRSLDRTAEIKVGMIDAATRNRANPPAGE